VEPRAQQDDSTVVLCKLETLTWNPETAELTWVISVADLGAGQDHPPVQEQYTIHVDTATMNFKEEARRFNPEEAQQVAKLMDLISTYTVQSTVWWSKGLGDKTEGTKGTEPEPKQRDKNKDEKHAPLAPGLRVANGSIAPAKSPQ
jgi:hypothetical protein